LANDLQDPQPFSPVFGEEAIVADRLCGFAKVGFEIDISILRDLNKLLCDE